ncbi:hypothetical protein BKA57DRAFT_431584 [Linnemannia elongata]|nr:hypothetical protein BKA57DRAFT_431584 [Linnemannia elongata]
MVISISMAIITALTRSTSAAPSANANAHTVVETEAKAETELDVVAVAPVPLPPQETGDGDGSLDFAEWSPSYKGAGGGRVDEDEEIGDEVEGEVEDEDETADSAESNLVSYKTRVNSSRVTKIPDDGAGPEKYVSAVHVPFSVTTYGQSYDHPIIGPDSERTFSCLARESVRNVFLTTHPNINICALRPNEGKNQRSRVIIVVGPATNTTISNNNSNKENNKV